MYVFLSSFHCVLLLWCSWAQVQCISTNKNQNMGTCQPIPTPASTTSLELYHATLWYETGNLERAINKREHIPPVAIKKKHHNACSAQKTSRATQTSPPCLPPTRQVGIQNLSTVASKNHKFRENQITNKPSSRMSLKGIEQHPSQQHRSQTQPSVFLFFRV